MSNKARIGLIAAAAVVAVAAFVIASNGDDEGGDTAATTTTSAPATTSGKTTTAPEAIPRSVIRLKDHKPVGGRGHIIVSKGDRLQIEVVTDVDDSIHLHGYDVEKEAKPGRPAVFDVKATIEGNFEIESHTAEHEGLPPVIATLTVNPS